MEFKAIEIIQIGKTISMIKKRFEKKNKLKLAIVLYTNYIPEISNVLSVQLGVI